jgi:hypothetical protein
VKNRTVKPNLASQALLVGDAADTKVDLEGGLEAALSLVRWVVAPAAVPAVVRFTSPTFVPKPLLVFIVICRGMLTCYNSCHTPLAGRTSRTFSVEPV